MNNERHRRSPRFDTARRKWKSSQEYRIVCWSYMDVKRQMPYLLPTHFPWYIQYTICTRWCELWANNVQNLPIYIVVEWRWRCCWGLGVVYVDILGSLIRHQSVSLCLIWSFLSRINMNTFQFNFSILFCHYFHQIQWIIDLNMRVCECVRNYDDNEFIVAQIIFSLSYPFQFQNPSGWAVESENRKLFRWL